LHELKMAPTEVQDAIDALVVRGHERLGVRDLFGRLARRRRERSRCTQAGTAVQTCCCWRRARAARLRGRRQALQALALRSRLQLDKIVAQARRAVANCAHEGCMLTWHVRFKVGKQRGEGACGAGEREECGRCVVKVGTGKMRRGRGQRVRQKLRCAACGEGLGGLAACRDLRVHCVHTVGHFNPEEGVDSWEQCRHGAARTRQLHRPRLAAYAASAVGCALVTSCALEAAGGVRVHIVDALVGDLPAGDERAQPVVKHRIVAQRALGTRKTQANHREVDRQVGREGAKGRERV
jgi:hypothetical protein